MHCSVIKHQNDAANKLTISIGLYTINDIQCEPHHQHHNPAERRIQEVKKTANAIMDRAGTPAKYWLLCPTLYDLPLQPLIHGIHWWISPNDGTIWKPHQLFSITELFLV
jgi:hypothetical protein